MDDFDDLFIKGQEVDRQLVGGILKPLLQIEQETCGIRPRQAWRRASNEVKLLAYLLARKAMVAHGLQLEREAAAPSEVIAATGIPSGSVHPTLKGLYESRPQLVDKDESRRYFVPSWAVDAVSDYVHSHLDSRGE
jgi:3-oxoacyl-(acyl-carrier-protein) synthase